MRRSRRAASDKAGLLGVFGAAVAVAASVIVGGTTLSFAIARKVVTPATRRLTDVEVLGVDRGAQTITLGRSLDTILPGRYGLFINDAREYLKIGSVLDQSEHAVTRKLLTHVPAGKLIAPAATFSGWYFVHPDELHIPYEDVLIDAPVGPCPAWLFPARAGEFGSTWAISVHGRGTTRSEVLRAAPVFRDAGVTSIAVSYRNDGEAGRSSSGRYGLGATEWRDVEAAIEFARSRGAKRIVLMGWSMGGAIALQTVLNTAYTDVIDSVILESPVVDWRTVLNFQARALHVPAPVAHIVRRQLTLPRWSRAVRAGNAISLNDLDVVSRADELTHPILLMHSDDDGFVPSEASHSLAEARPDLVRLVSYSEARHTKLWNYDETRWRRHIVAWLRDRGLGADVS